MALRSAVRSGDAPVVLAQRLTKIFKDFWLRPRVKAVDNLDIEVQRGEIFGLLGPNGSGKSTTIKILLGLLHKTSGRVAVFGKPPSDVEVKRRIGVLPEESYLYPFLTARETLDYYGKLFGLNHKARSKRSDELLEMVGLQAVADRQVKEYSKGMQRRIGLAQALINDPEFLVLDEPTSGLDPIGSRQVKDLIIDLGRRGKTILLSSHQLSDVEDVVHRMAILYGGKKRAEGTCDELLMARSRLAIETDTLDDETISQIDQLIHERTGGSILRVASPRQRLEDLFVKIVEEARAERIETAGAGAGGPTAAFLLGQESGDGARLQGEALISSLVSEEAGPVEGATAAPEQAALTADEETSADVISNLVAEEDSRPKVEPRQGARGDGSKQAPPPAQEDVDLDVIGSLLDDTGDGEKR